jgi:tetratricopeptide (TPR) repeat protein
MNEAFQDNLQLFTRAVSHQDWETAEKAARSLLRLAPESAGLHYNLGLVLKHKGKLEDASSAFRSALNMDKTHQKARFELGCILTDQDKLQEALSCFTGYIATNADDEDALLNAARIALRLGDLDLASQYAGRLIRAGGDQLLLQAELSREEGDVQAMLHQLKQAVRHDPGLKAAALKIATQGAAGRMPLDANCFLRSD